MDQQLLAVFGILAFLAAGGLLAVLLGVAALAALLGSSRLAGAGEAAVRWLFGGRGLAAKALAATGTLCACYLLLLFGFSLASRDRTLAPGEEKYFCEIDCHLAYSVLSADSLPEVGGTPGVRPAPGMFLRVTLRTRFDETTISASRPRDFPLTPAPREIYLVGAGGERYPVSADGESALEISGASGTPLTRPLRPGESFTTELVFDVPSGIRAPRLLVLSPTQPQWIGRILIGGEGSFLHAKVYQSLPRRGSAGSAAGD